MFTERNQLKQQCTQAIRQWDTAIRERNDYKEQYAKVYPFIFTLVLFINESFNSLKRQIILSQYLGNIQVKRQHEEDIKEINQNMIVRVKASKDIKRLTDERNAAMQVRHIKKKNESNRTKVLFVLDILVFF